MEGGHEALPKRKFLRLSGQASSTTKQGRGSLGLGKGLATNSDTKPGALVDAAVPAQDLLKAVSKAAQDQRRLGVWRGHDRAAGPRECAPRRRSGNGH